MYKVAILLTALCLACDCSASGFAQYKHGFSIFGPHGAAQLDASGSNHGYDFQLSQQHKHGSSYVKQSGSFSHEVPLAVGHDAGFAADFGGGHGGHGAFDGGFDLGGADIGGYGHH